MKKILSTILAITLIAVCFAVTAGAATEEVKTNLFENTVMEAVLAGTAADMEAGNVKLDYEYKDGIFKAENQVGWPYLSVKYGAGEGDAFVAAPITVDADNTAIELSFTLAGGGTSIRMMFDVDGVSKLIYLNHFLEDLSADTDYDGSGDLITAGTYTLTIDMADLKYWAGTENDKYMGMDEAVAVEGEISLTGLQLYAIGATVTIDKFNLITEADIEDNSSVESTSSEASSTSSSTTPTGDAGYIALAVIAVVALAGAVVVKKVR